MLVGFSFLKDNITSIIILTIVIFTLLVISAIYNPQVNDKDMDKNKSIGKIVTIEALVPFEQGPTSLPFASAFCDKYKHDPNELQKKCNKMSKKECTVPSCCVLLNGAECVAGDIHGPTFHGTTDNPIKTEYWYYKNTCYPGKGECPT